MAAGFGSTYGAGTTDRSTSPAFTLPKVFSWAMWRNRHGSGGASTGRLFQKGSGANTVYSYHVDPAVIRFEVVWSIAAGQWDITAAGADTWAHVAVTYDGSSTANNPLMYLGGTSQTVTESNAPSGTWTPASTGVTIGNDPTGVRNWDGMLADFVYCPYILHPQEIAFLASGGSPLLLPRGVGMYRSLYGRQVVTAPDTIIGTRAQPHPPLTSVARLPWPRVIPDAAVVAVRLVNRPPLTSLIDGGLVTA